MKTLRSLQQKFKDYLLSGARVMEEEVAGTAGHAAERLKVYGTAYRSRLVEALEEDFSGLQSLMGGVEEFRRLGFSYVAAHPSQHYSIRWFGRHLAAFLRATPPYSNRPVLAEMAAFEWALTEAFDAADAEAVTFKAVERIPSDAWGAMRLVVHPSVRRLDLQWNVPSVRPLQGVTRSIDAGKEVEGVKEAPSPVGWVVWRKDLSTYYRSLSGEEAWALDRARAGDTFADICEGLCDWMDGERVAMHAALLLKCWISEGLIAHIATARCHIPVEP